MCYIFLEAMAHLVSFTYELWLFSIATFGKRHNKSLFGMVYITQ